MMCTPAMPGIARIAWIISMQILRPSRCGSAACSSRLRTSSGMYTRDLAAQPARGLCRTERADADEDMAAFVQTLVAHALHIGLEQARSKQYCVCTNCAPAAILRASRIGRMP